MIDIVTTATRRSTVYFQSVASFIRNMLSGYDCRLIINIDPVGTDTGCEMEDVVKQFFKYYKINTPSAPSFPKAFKWCWDQVQADYVLNLEDDWILTEKIDLTKLINILDSEQDLASLRLPFKAQDRTSMKNWKYFFPYNGLYYECPSDLKRTVGFCGHPSLLRGEFVKNCAKHLTDDFNPEKQFHSRANTKLMYEVDKWRYGVAQTDSLKPAVYDIGRQWMIKNGFVKSGNKAIFQVWEVINEQSN